MKSLFKVRVFFASAICFCGPSFAGAQTLSLVAGKEQAFASTQASFLAHNYDLAEQTLLADNVSPQNTPHWEREAGSILTRMAFTLRTAGDAEATTAIAKRALTHFRKADAAFGLDSDPVEVAEECEQAGYLCEYLLGDGAAAKSLYQKAVKLSPKTGNAAGLLDILVRTEAEEAKKKAFVPEN